MSAAIICRDSNVSNPKLDRRRPAAALRDEPADENERKVFQGSSAMNRTSPK
jgi:hypothetical protein